MTRLGSLVRHDVRFAMHSDAPMGPILPLLAVETAVTRRTLDGMNPGGWVPAQKVTVEEAVAAYTRGAAHASFEEGVKGTLTPGPSRTSSCSTATSSRCRPSRSATRGCCSPRWAAAWCTKRRSGDEDREERGQIPRGYFRPAARACSTTARFHSAGDRTAASPTREALSASQPDENKLKPAVGKLEKNHREIMSLRDKEISAIKDNLTVAQQARYFLFHQEFQREMRGMVESARKGTGKGRGPGMGGASMKGQP